MPAPSAILERPEFQILRRLSVEQLRRINPETAQRYDWTVCPLGQAFDGTVFNRKDIVYRLAGKYTRRDKKDVVWEETYVFTNGWDDAEISPADLAAAIAAALAEKEGTDARP
jgi:hypothetical protein